MMLYYIYGSTNIGVSDASLMLCLARYCWKCYALTMNFNDTVLSQV